MTDINSGTLIAYELGLWCISRAIYVHVLRTKRGKTRKCSSEGEQKEEKQEDGQHRATALNNGAAFQDSFHDERS